MADISKKDWWKDAVIYQIYPKSFLDTNGDGIGDLPGITARLDYLQDLGVDGIWLSPINASPQEDNGYDISDYRAIDPMFGTMEDFETLVREAKKRGLVIIMDLVLNHTSDRHHWFEEAKKSKDSPYHDYYIWRDGREGELPTDWPAVFGGSVWNWVPEVGQYYYAAFSPYQPDLNWDNPKVRQELFEMIRFWIDKGVGGFRLDAIGHVGKDLEAGIEYNGPKLHPYLRELRTQALKDGIMTVGEAGREDLATIRQYTDGSELDMVFEFSLHHYKYDPYKIEMPSPREIGEYCRYWQQAMHDKGWNAPFLENHDLPRIVSRWGNEGPYWRQSATMLAMLLLGLEGTPFIYQGSELGMTNHPMAIEDYVDLATISDYDLGVEMGIAEDELLGVIQQRSRDNARTPMQWENVPNAGFTSGHPWLKVNPNYETINAAAETADPHSVFSFYKKLIGLRREHETLRHGTFALIPAENENIVMYERSGGSGNILVVLNFSEETVPFEVPAAYAEAEVLAANCREEKGTLPPFAARMLLRR